MAAAAAAISTGMHAAVQLNHPKMEQNFFTSLPSDITIDILSRLHFLEIVKCKCVCHSWRNLVKTPDFVKLHLSKSVVGLAWFSRRSQASFIHEVADDNNCENYRIEFVSPAKIQSSVDGLLFHCDSSESLYLSNPITRDLIELPPAPPTPPNRPHMFGFGVTKTSRQYKIVSLSLSLIKPAECHVYTVGTRWWRRSRARVPIYTVYTHTSTAPFINGVVHWLVVDMKRCMHISCFDLETEAFTTFSPRQVFDSFCGHYQSLSALEGCLCLCGREKDGEIVIWCMKEYGNDGSWRKEFIIKMESSEGLGYLFVPVKVYRNGDLLVVRMKEGSGKGKVLCYFIKTETFEIKQRSLYVKGNVVVWTPSFVPVQPVSYLKRKLECDY